jgi:hypothetical protein
MTIQKFLLEKLEEKGLWIEEAEALLEIAKQSPKLAPMKNRLLETVEQHAPVVIILTLMATESIALEWLKENAPDHFAISNFEKKKN